MLTLHMYEPDYQFFLNSLRAHSPVLTQFSKQSQGPEVIYSYCPQEDKQLGDSANILTVEKNLLHELSLLSDPSLRKFIQIYQIYPNSYLSKFINPNVSKFTCINRKSGLTRPAIVMQALTLAHEGRWCFPRVDSCSDEHHFLLSPWTQVLCSRRGWQGTDRKREKDS